MRSHLERESPDPMVKKRLRELNREQTTQVEKLGLAHRPMNGLFGLTQLSGDAMATVSDSFRARRANAGSWIKGQSLAIQLIRQHPLTVDVAPEDLKKVRPFGLPFQSLLRLVQNNLVFLNLRNYDSDVDLTQHDDQTVIPGTGGESVASRLNELLKYRGALYIGSSLRGAVFNSALTRNGYDQSYAVFQQTAAQELAPAFECYQEVESSDPDHIRELLSQEKHAFFRGEQPSLVAASWHWAYLCAVSFYIETVGLLRLGDQDTELARLYRETADLGEGGQAPTASPKTKKAAAAAFVKLASRLRCCHLNYTAPITASWGSTYNLTSSEYSAASRLVEGEQRISDEMLDQFLAYILAEQDPRLRRLNRYIHALEDRSDNDRDQVRLNETVNDVIFDDDAIKALIDALLTREADLRNAANALSELHAAYALDQRFSINNLITMLDDYRDVRHRANSLLIRSLQGGTWDRFWNYVVMPVIGAGAGAVAGPLAPWVLTMVAEECKANSRIPDYVFRRVFREPSHRALYQVHKAMQSKP